MLQGNFIQEKKIELGTRWSREDEATAQPRWAPLIPHSTGMRSHEIMQRCGTAQQLSVELRGLWPLSLHTSASFCLHGPASVQGPSRLPEWRPPQPLSLEPFIRSSPLSIPLCPTCKFSKEGICWAQPGLISPSSPSAGDKG